MSTTSQRTGNALLLVDIQNDFIPGGSLVIPGGDEVVPIANRLSRRFDLVLASQDWHPADHGSFASQYGGRSPGDVVELNGLEQVLWPDHCVQGSPGAEFVTGLDMTRVDRVFRKGTDPGVDSYSAFFDNGRRKSTGLADYLAQKEVDVLYVMGLATDYCVKFTVLDARREGLRTFVVEDGCRGVELRAGDVAQALREMRDAGAGVVRSRQLSTRLQREARG